MAGIVTYTPEWFEPLARMARAAGRARSLLHRPFVDHYYAGSEWCRLYLYVAGDGAVLGTLGVECMPFEGPGGPLIMALGSNFHALTRGAGGILFLKWMSGGHAGLVLGGTADTHRLLRARRWRYLPGVRTYRLNAPYAPHPGERWWSALAKRGLRRWRRTLLARHGERLGRTGVTGVTVHEERAYAADLVPRRSAFAVRFAPPPPYLAWRYGLGLPFVRYRLFRVCAGSRSIGYVVVNESPDRVIVAHADGEDAARLAHGALLAALTVARDDTEPRGLVLLSAHPAMEAVYARFGMRAGWRERPLAVGGAEPLPALPDVRRWLVSYDWGDHALRAPFLDQTALAA